MRLRAGFAEEMDDGRSVDVYHDGMRAFEFRTVVHDRCWIAEDVTQIEPVWLNLSLLSGVRCGFTRVSGSLEPIGHQELDVLCLWRLGNSEY